LSNVLVIITLGSISVRTLIIGDCLSKKYSLLS